MGTALIVLGGGRGRRLGGLSKPDLRVGGRRLLDIALAAGQQCAPRVAVVPAGVEVPLGVLRTLEDPPDGGPVAGIAAGLGALRRAEEVAPVPSDVLVLACDLPGAAGLVDPLRRARSDPPPSLPGASRVDGVIACGAEGRREMLAFLADRAALERDLRRDGDRDRSVRSLLAGLRLREVAVAEHATEDVDTWDQHARWEERA